MILTESYKEYQKSKQIAPELLFEILKSPRHFKYAMDNGLEETEEQKLKRYLDCYIFEGIEQFANQYIETNKNYGDLEFRDINKEIIPIKTYEKLKEMIESFRENKQLGEILFKRINVQSSYYATIGENEDVQLKCRIQSFCHQKKFFLTTHVVKNADPIELRDKTFNYLLFNYAFVYRALQNITNEKLLDYNFYIVLIESEIPYNTSIYQFKTQTLLKKAFGLFNDAANLVAICKEENFYPGYEYGNKNGIIEL